MMLFNTAIKELKRRKVMNVITVIEFAVSIILVGVMVTAVMIKYKYYAPFKDIYRSNGIYCEFVYAADGFGKPEQRLLFDEQLFAYLPEAEEIICSNEVKSFPIINGEPVEAKCYSYNDELIRRYRPYVGGGEWFDLNSTEIQALVSENHYGWDVGDSIQIIGNEDCLLTVRIIGMLKSGEKLPAMQHEHNGSTDFNMFFSEPDAERTDIPKLLFSSSQLSNNGFIGQSCRSALITYPEEVSESQLDSDKKELLRLGGIFTTDLKTIEEASIDYFLTQLSNYLPLLIVVLVLTFVSSISITALSTRQRLRDYTVYYICGSTWQSCALVNLFYSVIISLLALISSFAVYKLLPRLPSSFFADLPMTIASDRWVVISVTVLIGLFILVSMIMPLIIIGRNTPKEILTGRNDR